MSLAARALSLVLVALVALAGASLDLCACAAGSHGLLCAGDDGGHPAPPAAAVVEDAGCCGGGAAVSVQTAARSSGATISATDCACPVVTFEAPPAETAAAAPAAPDLAHAALALPPVDERLVAAVSLRAGHARAPPPTPTLRRHLALHVLRL